MTDLSLMCMRFSYCFNRRTEVTH